MLLNTLLKAQGETCHKAVTLPNWPLFLPFYHCKKSLSIPKRKDVTYPGASQGIYVAQRPPPNVAEKLGKNCDRHRIKLLKCDVIAHFHVTLFTPEN